MNILENYDLKNLNTFNVPAFARFFVEIKNENELRELLLNPLFLENNKLFLGEGSNVLFTKDFDGIVILNQLKGIEVVVPNSDNIQGAEKDDIYIRAMSGEVWNDLVSFAIDNNYWGIENLAFIPGTVGAAPMQNIGAYGAELKDVLLNVEVYEINTGEKIVFNKKQCALGYRDSIFKNSLKNKYFISAITLRLSKIPSPNLSYKVLREYFEKPARTTDVVQSGRNKIEIKNPKDISDAVYQIRSSKLPDPKVIGNAGSFFKNAFIKKEQLEDLLKSYPEMPYFSEKEKIKIPASWLIEQCDWKGKRMGNIGVYDKQALILVNYGNASGQDIKALADEIIASVFNKFKITLIPEVNLIP